MMPGAIFGLARACLIPYHQQLTCVPSTTTLEQSQKTTMCPVDSMLNNIRLPFKFLLLSALLISASLSATTKDNSSNRWQCRATTEGGWACGNIKPADGWGTRFVAPQRTPAVAPTTRASYKIDGQQLDWAPRQALNEVQKQAIPNYCSGRYIEPDYIDAEQRALDPTSQPIKGAAQSSQTDENGITTLTGDVVFSQGYRQIKGAKAILNRDAGTADFEGHVQYREPGMLLLGNDTHVNLSDNEATINNAKFVGHTSHMRGTAKKLTRQGNGVVIIEHGTVTYCEPDSNSWRLVGGKLKLDPEAGVGTVKHARLHIKDVPVLYVPYLSFPIDDRRKSGFLTPDISSSDGFDIATPYYWNIAPNYDATLTPRVIGDRGSMGEVKFRYLHNKNSGTLGGAYLVSDKLFMDEDRWLSVFNHHGSELNNITTLVDATAVSDTKYFNDLGADLNATSQTHLLRMAQANYTDQYWSLTTRVQGYQTIDATISAVDKPYDRLPQILLTGQYPHQSTGLEFGLLTEYSYFDRDNDGLIGIDRAVGHRTRIEPSVSWLFETPYAFVKPKATYRYAQYKLEDLTAGFNDTPNLSVPVFSFDSGLFFERDTGWGNSPLTQTFEPRLFYLNVPEEQDQLEIPDFDTGELDFSYNQLFREDRFVGGDRVGDANQLSVGLTSRFIETDGFERARASIGQIYYFDDRMVTLTDTPPVRTDLTSESALAAELMFALHSGWQLQGDIEWDPDIERTNQSSLYLRYHGDNRHLFNIGYRYRNDDREQLEQSDVSLIWPIGDHWSFISRWNQDLIHDRIVEAFAGIEYQSCCWAVRVLGRRWVNDNDLSAIDKVNEKEAIYIQFQLTGLGNIGDSMERLFRDSIPGYQEKN